MSQPLQRRNALMISTKYIGMDVHKESISIAVRNAAGKVVMECVIETKASMILQFIDGLRGEVQVTFEEGTAAAWLYDMLKPHVSKLVVCDPRKNKSMREGNQSDKIDARQLAELLRLDHLYRNVADFIQKQSTLVRQFEPPNLWGYRSRKRSLFMSKQLAFQQPGWNCCTVQLHECPLFAAATVVNRASNQLLSRASFSKQQNRGIAWG